MNCGRQSRTTGKSLRAGKNAWRLSGTNSYRFVINTATEGAPRLWSFRETLKSRTSSRTSLSSLPSQGRATSSVRRWIPTALRKEAARALWAPAQERRILLPTSSPPEPTIISCASQTTGGCTGSRSGVCRMQGDIPLEGRL